MAEEQARTGPPDAPGVAGLHPSAYEEGGDAYVPYVQEDGQREFTFRAVVCGAVLGVIFGAANTYLGLMAGLTISTSIPVAVLTVVLFRALGVFGTTPTILEANTSQTIGSASSSVASGVLFTVPALFLWGLSPSLAQLTALAMCGGLLGVLAMVPLRRYLIRGEHGKLPYPEGLACAEVLVATQEGGKRAQGVFWGLGFGLGFKLLTDGLLLIGSKLAFEWGVVSIASKVSPALVGVGSILGLRVASVMVAGAALSALVITPVIAAWGAGLEAPFYPETGKLIRDMSASEIWEKYVRYIGAGAVACAGIITLIRSTPTMIESLRLGLAQITSGPAGSPTRAGTPRTDRDLPFRFILAGVGLVLATLALVPGLLGFLDSFVVRLVAALLVGVFAFLFVTVAARIVGLVGVTSNPTSGMTIATLLGTSSVFWLAGKLGYADWTGLEGKATALLVGTCVAIAASIAGDTSQDLKTGFLLGATPARQQTGELLGVITSAFFVCATVYLLHESLGIGSDALPAPQATLMKLVIGGVIDQNLPWALIGIGAALAVIATLLRLPSLAFAVGVYLPLSTMLPVFLGGLLRWSIARRRGTAAEHASRREQGVLFASGLVGGEGLTGVLLALFVLLTGSKPGGVLPAGTPDWVPAVGAALGLGLILFSIRRAALRRVA